MGNHHIERIGMKAFITGITGMVGSHLAEYLLNQGIEVHGLIRYRSRTENITDLIGRVKFHQGDLLDCSSLQDAISVRPDLIFHLAAQSYVPYSFVAPQVTIETNCTGTANLLETIRLARKDKYDPIVHVCSCYDEETELLTQRGFIQYKNIQPDDMVLSFVDGFCVWKPIKRVVVNNYSGDIYRVQTRSIDFLVTPNHRFLFKSSIKGTFKLQPLLLNKPSRRYYSAAGRFIGNTSETIKIGSRAYSTADVLYILGVYIGDGAADHQQKTAVNRSGLSSRDFINDRDDRGCFKSGKRGSIATTISHCHRIFLYIPENDKSRQRVCDCLSRLGIRYSKQQGYLYFTSKDFVEFFDEITHNAHTKHIPSWVFEYDATLLDSLYMGLIDSDGHYYKTGEKFTTVSGRLADDMSKLCAFTGRFATVSRRESAISEIKGRKIICSPSYYFSISSKNRLFESSDVNVEHHNGKVWCLEVEETHNFFVRRNGKGIFCGNSSEVYGQVLPEEVPIKESNTLRPASPYAVSKVCEDMLAFQYYVSWGIKTIRSRMFTHCGPRRGDVFAESAFAKQIAEIEKGRKEPIVHVGNLDSVRTFLDVRDAVKAYWQMVNLGIPGDIYNIGGNETMTVGEMLNILLSYSTRTDIRIQIDPSLLRPSDVTLQIPCCDKFKNLTGWEPEIPLKQTLLDLLTYWRQII